MSFLRELANLGLNFLDQVMVIHFLNEQKTSISILLSGINFCPESNSAPPETGKSIPVIYETSAAKNTPPWPISWIVPIRPNSYRDNNK